MCGIIGKWGNSFTQKDIHAGIACILHRGPDETAEGATGAYAYGMNRLSIRGLVTGLYPFRYKHYELIFNGELYNTAELEQLLRAQGYRCTSTCDAELILPLFDRMGVDVFRRLCGMFAIAIYDKKTCRLTLARDQFGEKPLYYYHGGKSLFFSSELKAFPAAVRTVNTDAIPATLVFGFLPDRPTMYRNIFKVLPGEALVYDGTRDALSQHRYFRLQDALPSVPREPDLDQLDATVQQIMREKVVADVPVGVFLSGGVDSSLVAALATRVQRVRTFSIGFRGSQVDESPFALEVAKYLKSKHTHINFSASDVARTWDTVIASLDEPISDPAVFPTFLLAKEARKHVKVILTGEGADEMFGGYDRYKKEHLATVLRILLPFLPPQLTLTIPYQKAWKTFSPPSAHYVPVTYDGLWRNGMTGKTAQYRLIKQTWDEFVKEYGDSRGNDLSLLQLFDLRYYVAEQLCMKLDKMTMAHSVEPRAPFLDTRLIPWLILSAGTPRNKAAKYYLRRVAERYLPAGIVWRKKHGFSLPLADWLKGELTPLTDTLAHPHPAIAEQLSPRTIAGLLADFRSGAKDRYALTIWNLLVLNTWLRQHA